MAKVINSILGCTGKTSVSSSSEVILFLFSALVRSHLDTCVQFWASQYKRHGCTEESPVKDPHIWLRDCEERLRSVTAQPWEGKAPGVSYQRWREVQRRESQALSSGMSTDRTRVNGQRVEHIKFPLNIRKHFFYCKCDWPLAHIAQGDGDISVLGDIQKQHGYSPG